MYPHSHGRIEYRHRLRLIRIVQISGRGPMPFAGYKDFADCVAKNQDKANPEAYCAAIKAEIEGREEEDANSQEDDAGGVEE